MSHIARQTAIELAAQHGINAEESQLFGVGDLELLCNAAIQHYIDRAALAQPEPAELTVLLAELNNKCGSGFLPWQVEDAYAAYIRAAAKGGAL